MLQDKIKNRKSGIITYGLTPPKAGKTPEKLREIAAKQMARIEGMDIDALVLYDIQDEGDRISQTRPFPFMETIDPACYSTEYLNSLKLPRIIYRCPGKYTKEEFTKILNANDNSSAVFVGAASRNQKISLTLKEAYKLKQFHAPDLLLGGVTIPERHMTKQNEHSRVISKMDQGCSFFISQCIYNEENAKNFLSDYYYTCKKEKRPMVPIIFTITPCGSPKTLEFMKWLGISIPRWMENDLLHSINILEMSIELSLKIVKDLVKFCKEKEIPMGCNIESVSVRKVEIEASVYLVQEINKIINS